MQSGSRLFLCIRQRRSGKRRGKSSDQWIGSKLQDFDRWSKPQCDNLRATRRHGRSMRLYRPRPHASRSQLVACDSPDTISGERWYECGYTAGCLRDNFMSVLLSPVRSLNVFFCAFYSELVISKTWPKLWFDDWVQFTLTDWKNADAAPFLINKSWKKAWTCRRTISFACSFTSKEGENESASTAFSGILIPVFECPKLRQQISARWKSSSNRR